MLKASQRPNIHSFIAIVSAMEKIGLVRRLDVCNVKCYSIPLYWNVSFKAKQREESIA